MSTITKEQLRERARQKVKSLELAVTQTAFADSRAELEEELELARIALASLETEPAGYHVIKECGAVGCSVATLKEAEETRDFWNKNWTIKPYFYTAPPAPVSVPDESAVESLATDLMKRIDKITGERHSVATLSSLRVSIVDACRAVMLQGAVGNTPVIPDGWVACSQRMPEDTQMVLAFSHGEIVAAYWNYVMCPIEYKKYRAFTYLSGSLLEGVTHWMPLPAAPQQEVK